MTSTFAAAPCSTKAGLGRVENPFRVEVSQAQPNFHREISAKEFGPFGILTEDVRAALRWPAPCEAAFRFLVARYPDSLLLLIESGRMEAADLTYAVEIAGEMPWSQDNCRVLMAMLGHVSPMVREGALYGLAFHPRQEVLERISEVARTDKSPAVREAALAILEEV